MIPDALILSLATGPDVYTFKDFLDWLGRWHLLVLHTPIGLLAGVWLLNLAGLIFKKHRPGLRVGGSLILGLTALSAAAASALGWLLQQSNPKTFGTPLLQTHLLWGIGTAAALSVLWVIHLRLIRRGGWLLALIYPLGLIACSAMMAMTGHTGGTSVHSESFLTRGAPPMLQRMLEDSTKAPPPENAAPATPRVDAGVPETTGAPIEQTPGPQASPMAAPQASQKASRQADPQADPGPAPASVSDTEGGDLYIETILPIFDRYCFKCHDAGQKVRGGLDMTDPVALFAGGSSGLPGVVPGDPQGSELYLRMSLPQDDIDVMPPEDEANPVPAQRVQAVHDWIKAGAPMP